MRDSLLASAVIRPQRQSGNMAYIRPIT